jgi:two-component system KDP operon response regulator KdpE
MHSPVTDRDEPQPDVQELLQQVRTLLRHAVHAASTPAPAVAPTRFGPVEIDLVNRVVRRHHVVVALTPREYALLATLAQHGGEAVRREELLAAVWGSNTAEPSAKSRTVDQHICRLRRKLEPLPSHPRYIITVLGYGYRLAGLENGAT